MAKKIPEHYLQEYEDQQRECFRTRIGLFIFAANVIYAFVTFFYILRRFPLGSVEAFDPHELWNWLILLAGSGFFYFWNRRCHNLKSLKQSGYFFDLLLLFNLSYLGAIYPENSIVFSFYFGLVLFISVFTLPWDVPDVILLSVTHTIAFCVFYAYLVFVEKLSMLTFPRFHPFFDGVIFIAISAILCVLSRKKEIERDVDNFVLLKEVEEKNFQIQQDLDFAKRIQRTLVPDSIQSDKADITVSYVPMGAVGGDYAKFRFQDKDRLIFMICDVTGHGVAAALMVNRVHAEFELLAKDEVHPGMLLKKLDRFIVEDFAGTGMYLSAFCGSLDFKTKKFIYSNYGHPPQYIYQSHGGKVQRLQAQTFLLGLDISNEMIYENEITFGRGDSLLLFTDGILEATNESGEQYGGNRVEDFLIKNISLPPQKFNEELLADLHAYHRGTLKDDVFLLSVRVH